MWQGAFFILTMKMMVGISLIFLLAPFFAACDKEDTQQAPSLGSELYFDTIPISRPLVPMILETSGIADSKLQPGNLWGHEDSGTPTQLFLLGHDGQVKSKVLLKGTHNRDWEEMAISGTDLFVGDIGDNRQIYPSYTIYQFAEPQAGEEVVENIKSIRFTYPDGSHDAEAFFIEPATKDLYIITKRDQPSRLYKLRAPYSYTEMNVLSYVGELPYTGIVAASMAADGKELILKTYTSLYYYKIPSGIALSSALLKEGTALPYQLEPQGEAVAFAHDGSGFYTLSEKGFSSSVHLYFYQRR